MLLSNSTKNRNPFRAAVFCFQSPTRQQFIGICWVLLLTRKVMV
jgi:hypothetical protein